MAKWHYQKNGTTHGPIDSAQLKQLAQSGGVGPDDLLRRDDMQKWAKASKVQGLFGTVPQLAPQAPSAAPPLPPSPMVESSTPGQSANVADSTSTRKMSKLRRNLLIGLSILLVIGFIGNVADLRRMNSSYAEATRLWDAGQKQEAVALYRPLTERTELRDEKKQILFQRLVEFELANGSADSARQLLQKAMMNGVAVTPTTSEGQKLLAELKSKEAAKATTQQKPIESKTTERQSGTTVHRAYLTADEQLAMAHPGTEYGGVVFVDQTRLLSGWLGDFSRQGVLYKRLKSGHYLTSKEDIEYEEEFDPNSKGQVCKKRTIRYGNGQSAAVNAAQGSEEEEILWNDNQCSYWDKDGTPMTSHEWHVRHFGDDYGAVGGRFVERRDERFKKQFIETYKRLEQEDRARGR